MASYTTTTEDDKSLSYPKFYHPDIKLVFLHWFLSPDRHPIKTCKLCKLNTEIIKFTILFFFRTILDEVCRKCHGSNSIALLMGDITPLEADVVIKDENLFLLDFLEKHKNDDDDENLYKIISNNRLQRLFDKYFPIFDEEIITYNFVDINVSACQYIPLLEFNDLFKILISLYNELMQGCTTVRSYVFYLLSFHVNGIFAIKPSYVYLMWSETISTDLLLLINTL